MNDQPKRSSIDTEIVYDEAGSSALSNGEAIAAGVSAAQHAAELTPIAVEGDGCHAGAKTLHDAAAAAGK